MNLLYKAIQTASTMWPGIQLTVGYVIALVLFHLLFKTQAEEIVDILFATITPRGLVAFGVAYAFFRKQLTSLSWWILALRLLLVCGHPLVIPVIGAHKYGLGNWLLSLVGGILGA